ncbi:related to oxidoreductase, short chain dehydrogenase/reductase family [Pseudozyma flocculosa]|uniref:Related to oxidoreductase, short chain dehydrogenase/reductase family n=1 Tax=Pseudozyma flocculosa TaxID=84751 RepID=A0A5C3FCL5_9BASI|nr:related to oxidoreductase, short chain dehydrogenase/reductase family [Pseudozyma flocculosa]
MVPMPTSTDSTRAATSVQDAVLAATQGQRSAAPNNLFTLKDTTSLVTGAARGIGLTLAAALLEAGSHVACLDLLDEPSDAPEWLAFRARAKELGLNASYIQADITDSGNINAVVDHAARTAADAARPLRTVVHAAAVQKQGPLIDFDAESFDWVMRVNVTGSFIVTQAAARAMRAHSRGGSIVLIASMSGQVANRGLYGAAYNSSKAAVHQLCRSAAVELAEHGIRVNTISPGYVATDMTRQLLAVETTLLDRWTDDNPMRRIGEPSEFKGAAVFLASEASSFMTGADMRIDGGMA